jgi:hypothetical protein
MNQVTFQQLGELFTSLLFMSGTSFTRWKSFVRDSSINGDLQKPMTAGKVGKKFKTAVTESTGLARPLSARLKEAAKTFMEFAEERNELVHAHVYSDPDGRQQLVYQRKDKTRTWSVAEIDDLAHRFENSSIGLRGLMQEVWNC